MATMPDSLSDAVARSLAAAPPGQTVEEWARTTVEGRMIVLAQTLAPAPREAWMRAGARMVRGMPAEEARRLARKECGMAVEAPRED